MGLRRGFTLLELLIVMTIVAIMSTMTVGAVRLIRERLRNNQTTSRMEAAITAFTQVGQGEGSAAMVFQRDAGLDGVLGWRQSKTDGEMVVRIINTPDGTFQERIPQTLPDEDYWTNRNLRDPFPKRLGVNWVGIPYADRDAGGKDDGSQPYMRFPWGEVTPQELLPAGKAITRLPDTFYLRHSSPHKTRELLTVAGVIPRAMTATVQRYRDYMTDRSPKRDWNDAWGRPLVVAYAFYHPPINSTRDNLNPATNDPSSHGKDVILSVCRAKYQRTRGIYLTMAAIGPTLPVTLKEENLTQSKETYWDGPGSIPGIIWQRVVGDGSPTGSRDGKVGVCQQGEAAKVKTRGGKSPPKCTVNEWTEKSWSNPPWQGMKMATYKDPVDKLEYRCFLSLPTPLN